MKYLFVVNPIAGGSDKTENVRSQAEELFSGRPDDSFEIYVTKKPMDAAREIRSRAEGGDEFRVLACGGDGTFNECVCGAAGLKNVAVAPFPTGTGNDFCRMFGSEKDMFRDLSALADGFVHPIDLVDCNGRYCVNLCSVGFDARVGENVHKYSKLPLIGGATGYVVSLLVEVFKGLNRPMEITCGGKKLNGEFALACVCNGRYYGGGFKPSLSAMPDDGELDIYVVKRANLFMLLKYVGKYASGRSDEVPNQIYHFKGDSISIRFEEESVINIDGEAIYAKDAVMKLVPLSLNLLAPKGLRFFD